MVSNPQHTPETVYYDLSGALPATAVGRDPHWRGWRLVPWESSRAAGQALFAHGGAGAQLSLPLSAAGWHAISIGLWSPPYTQTRLRLRLSGDSTWQELWVRTPCRWIAEDLSVSPYTFEEHFWRLADLTGKSLELTGTDAHSGLGFVRLIPLTESQVERLGDARRVPCLWEMDGHSPFAQTVDPPTRAITDDIDEFAGSDFTELSWNILGADLVNYRTAVGTLYGTAPAPHLTASYGRIAENIHRTLQTGADPTEVAVARARQHGMAIWVAQRMQAFAMEPPFDAMFDSRFCLENRQWACVTRDGKRLMQMSYAYPEVRRRLIEILLEVLPHRPDGIHLIFNRGVPCTYFEPPMVDGFSQEFEADMRSLPALDPRVVAFRARILTTFLRELRAAMESRGFGQVKVAVNCFQNRAINDEFGLDVVNWAQEGLVQRLMPFRWEWQWQQDYDMPFWGEAVRGTGCEVFVHTYNGNRERNNLPQQHRQRALELLRAGAAGLCAWDGPPYLGSLNLGRPTELAVWEELSIPLPQARLRTVGGFVVDEAPPIWGF